MKKKIIFFVLFCLITGVVGYYFYSIPPKNNMNVKIQNVFFDTPFGASQEVLIRNFAKHGFDVDKSISTEDWVIFSIVDTTTSNRDNKKNFSFGGRNWKHLDAFFNNGKFCTIRFQSSFNDKAAALSEYEGLLSTIYK